MEWIRENEEKNNLEMKKLIKELVNFLFYIWVELINLNILQNYPPLAELSVDDICGNVGSYAWKYIQHVKVDEIINDKDDDDEDTELGIYTIICNITINLNKKIILFIVTDPKWLTGLKEGNDGTTSFEQTFQLPTWSKKDHPYFPRSFRIITKQLLMMRLPRHAPNVIADLPEPVFLLVVGFLGVMSYQETDVPTWEINMFDKKRKLTSN